MPTRRRLPYLFAVVHLASALVGLFLFARGDLVAWPWAPLLFAGSFTLVGLAASALSGTPLVHPRTAMLAIGTVIAIASIPTQNRLLRAVRTRAAVDARAALVGRAAPSIEIEHAHGLAAADAQILDSRRGRMIVLDFCAPWSERCQDTARDLERFHLRHRDDVLVVMATRRYLADATAEQLGIATFATTFEVSFPIVIVAATTEQHYRVPSLPTVVIIAADGTVVDHAVGHEQCTEVLTELESLLTNSTRESVDGP